MCERLFKQDWLPLFVSPIEFVNDCKASLNPVDSQFTFIPIFFFPIQIFLSKASKFVKKNILLFSEVKNLREKFVSNPKLRWEERWFWLWLQL